MREIPELPAVVKLAIEVPTPKGIFGIIKFYLWKTFKVESELRNFLRILAVKDERIPSHSTGDFVFGHEGGLSSLDVTALFNDMREACQAHKNVENILLSRYNRIVNCWLQARR